MKRQRMILFAFALFWMLIIFFYSAQPAQQSRELSQKVVIKLQEIGEETSFLGEWLKWSELEYFVRKVAHAVEYAILGGIIFLNFKNWFLKKRRRFYIIGSEVFCVLYAVSDELHQYFVPGRSCQISDVILDSVGALSGILLVMFSIDYIKKRIKGRKCRRNKNVDFLIEKE